MLDGIVLAPPNVHTAAAIASALHAAAVATAARTLIPLGFSSADHPLAIAQPRRHVKHDRMDDPGKRYRKRGLAAEAWRHAPGPWARDESQTPSSTLTPYPGAISATGTAVENQSRVL